MTVQLHPKPLLFSILLLPVAAAAGWMLERAWRRGVRDPRIAYCTSALAAAAFGMLTAAVAGGFRLGIVDTSMIPAVAGVLIGGVRFARGDGSLLTAFGAAAILQLADIMSVALGLSYEGQLMAMALVMLLAAAWPQLRAAAGLAPAATPNTRNHRK